MNDLAHDHHWRFPDIEYVLWAIVFGLIIANTVGVPQIFKPGIGTREFWLKAGIVALGSRFVLGEVAKLGGISFVLILIDMTVAGELVPAAGQCAFLSSRGRSSFRRQDHGGDGSS